MSFSNCISSLVENRSANPDSPLEAREKALPLFEGLGPPDLCVLTKHKQTLFNTSEPEGYYHWVVGVEANLSRILAYYASLLKSQEPKKSWAGDVFKVLGCTYCAYNAFRCWDVRITVALDNKPVVSAITARGERFEQLEIQTELFWDELFVSSILRAMAFSPEQFSDIRGALNLVTLFANPAVEGEYLTVLKKYILKGVHIEKYPGFIDKIFNVMNDVIIEYFSKNLRFKALKAFYYDCAQTDPVFYAIIAEAEWTHGSKLDSEKWIAAAGEVAEDCLAFQILKMKQLCFIDKADAAFNIGTELLKKNMACFDLCCALSEILWLKMSFVESLKILNYVKKSVMLDDPTQKMDRIGLPRDMDYNPVTCPDIQKRSADNVFRIENELFLDLLRQECDKLAEDNPLAKIKSSIDLKLDWESQKVFGIFLKFAKQVGWDSFVELFHSVFYAPNEEVQTESTLNLLSMETQLALQHKLEDCLVLKIIAANQQKQALPHDDIKQAISQAVERSLKLLDFPTSTTAASTTIATEEGERAKEGERDSKTETATQPEVNEKEKESGSNKPEQASSPTETSVKSASNPKLSASDSGTKESQSTPTTAPISNSKEIEKASSATPNPAIEKSDKPSSLASSVEVKSSNESINAESASSPNANAKSSEQNNAVLSPRDKLMRMKSSSELAIKDDQYQQDIPSFLKSTSYEATPPPIESTRQESSATQSSSHPAHEVPSFLQTASYEVPVVESPTQPEINSSLLSPMQTTLSNSQSDEQFQQQHYDEAQNQHQYYEPEQQFAPQQYDQQQYVDNAQHQDGMNACNYDDANLPQEYQQQYPTQPEPISSRPSDPMHSSNEQLYASDPQQFGSPEQYQPTPQGPHDGSLQAQPLQNGTSESYDDPNQHQHQQSSVEHFQQHFSPDQNQQPFTDEQFQQPQGVSDDQQQPAGTGDDYYEGEDPPLNFEDVALYVVALENTISSANEPSELLSEQVIQIVDSLSQIERRFYSYLQRLLPNKDEDLTLLHQRLVAIVQRHQLIRREFGFSLEADHDGVHLNHSHYQDQNTQQAHQHANNGNYDTQQPEQYYDQQQGQESYNYDGEYANSHYDPYHDSNQQQYQDDKPPNLFASDPPPNLFGAMSPQSAYGNYYHHQDEEQYFSANHHNGNQRREDNYENHQYRSDYVNNGNPFFQQAHQESAQHYHNQQGNASHSRDHGEANYNQNQHYHDQDDYYNQQQSASNYQQHNATRPRQKSTEQQYYDENHNPSAPSYKLNLPRTQNQPISNNTNSANYYNSGSAFTEPPQSPRPNFPQNLYSTTPRSRDRHQSQAYQNYLNLKSNSNSTKQSQDHNNNYSNASNYNNDQQIQYSSYHQQQQQSFQPRPPTNEHVYYTPNKPQAQQENVQERKVSGGMNSYNNNRPFDGRRKSNASSMPFSLDRSVAYDPYRNSQFPSSYGGDPNDGGMDGYGNSGNYNPASLRSPNRSAKIDHPYDEKLTVEPPNLFAQNLTVPKLEDIQQDDHDLDPHNFDNYENELAQKAAQQRARLEARMKNALQDFKCPRQKPSTTIQGAFDKFKTDSDLLKCAKDDSTTQTHKGDLNLYLAQLAREFAETSLELELIGRCTHPVSHLQLWRRTAQAQLDATVERNLRTLLENIDRVLKHLEKKYSPGLVSGADWHVRRWIYEAVALDGFNKLGALIGRQDLKADDGQPLHAEIYRLIMGSLQWQTKGFDT